MDTIAFYVLIVIICLICTLLLFRGYRKSGMRLLFWSTVCFMWLTLANITLLADIHVFPSIDLRLIRILFSLTGVLSLLYGFVWEGE